MKIQSLNQDGIHQREIRGIQELQQALPDDWFGYTSLEMLDRKAGNLEIDLVICAFSRIIVVEIKDWNGHLTSAQGRWQLNGNDRGKSPVITIAEKARKLKSKLQIHLGKAKGCPWIESCVLLTGTANRNDLPDDEKAATFDLGYFKRLGGKGTFDKEFSHPNFFTRPVATIRKELDDFFLRGNFRSLTKSYNDYKPEERPFFRHPQGIFEEFYARKSGRAGYRALLRLWNFDELASIDASYANKTARQQVAFREIDAIGYLKAARPQLERQRLFLTPLSSEGRESVSTNFYELYDLPSETLRLQEFVARFDDKLRMAERIDLSRALLSGVAELHDLDVAHRDLGDHSIWIERPASVALSGFATASFPDQRTISEIRETIRAGSTPLPEDSLDLASDKFRRDVFLLGCALHHLLIGKRPPNNGGVPEWHPNEQCELSRIFGDWFRRALDWEPEKRFRNAGHALEAFKAAEPKAPGQELAPSDFEQFETSHVPYEKYPILESLEAGSRQVYRSKSDDMPCLVKLWCGTRFEQGNGASNLVLLSFLRNAQGIRDRRSDLLARIVDFGLCPAGLFIVQEWHEGETLEEVVDKATNREVRLLVAAAISTAVAGLHDQGFAHGDLKPANILIEDLSDEDASVRLLDVLDISSNGSTRTTPAYAPADYETATRQRCDTFAVAKIVELLLLEDNSLLEEHESTALRDALSPLLEDPNTSLASSTLPALLRDLRDGRMTAKSAVEEVLVYSRKLADVFEVKDDDGKIYVSSQPHRTEPERSTVFHLTGAFERIMVFYDRSLRLCTGLKVLPRSAIEVQHSEKKARWVIEKRIRIEPAENDDFDALGELLGELLEAQEEAAPRVERTAQAEDDPAAQVIEDVEVDVSAIWLSFVRCEDVILPEVEIEDSAELNASLGVYEIPVSIASRPFDFEESEEVEVIWVHGDGNPRTLGRMDVSRSEAGRLVLQPYYRDFTPPPPGARIRLQSRLHKSSLERRRKAVERIVDRRAIVRHLIDCVGGLRLSEELPVPGLDVDKIMDRYGLNPDQAAALLTAVSRVPISLIQGPPGTGKTHVISALVHYAIDHGIAHNVLLVSQSHEAVNNATDKVVAMFERANIEPSLVRVGMKGVLSDELHPYHTSAIRDIYREKFRANAASRVVGVAKDLGLPADLTHELYRLRLRLLQLAIRMERRQAQLGEGEPDEADEKLCRAFTEQAERFYRERFDPDGKPMDIVAQIEQSLCLDHGVSNPWAVAKVCQLIDLSFEWIDVLAEESNGFDQFLVKTRSIVTGTCVGVGRWNLGLEGTCFDLVIIDEAARCDPGELAVSMQVGSRIVLVGDHLQLPPLLDQELVQYVASDLGIRKPDQLLRSDFRRMFHSDYGKAAGRTLRRQYRMTEPICGLVSSCFYSDSGGLKTARGPSPALFDNLKKPWDASVIWYDTGFDRGDAMEKPEGSSYTNPHEADAIIDLLAKLVSNGLDIDELHNQARIGGADEAIGVIATYRAQSRLIKSRLATAPIEESIKDECKVDTVDSYQGKQNPIIVVSLTRSNPQGIVGFVRSMERLNVSLSRAMERLVIVGSLDFWRNAKRGESVASVIRYIEDRVREGDSRYCITSGNKQ